MMGLLGIGIGIGLTFAAVPGLIVGAVPEAETGSALGAAQVARYLGYSLGSALTASVLAGHTPLGHTLPTEAWLHARTVDRRGNQRRRRRSRLDTPRSARTCPAGRRSRRPRAGREPLPHRTVARIMNARERWNGSCHARSRGSDDLLPVRGAGLCAQMLAPMAHAPRGRPPRGRSEFRSASRGWGRGVARTYARPHSSAAAGNESWRLSSLPCE